MTWPEIIAAAARNGKEYEQAANDICDGKGFRRAVTVLGMFEQYQEYMRNFLALCESGGKDHIVAANAMVSDFQDMLVSNLIKPA